MASLLASPLDPSSLHPNALYPGSGNQPRQGILLNRNDLTPLTTPQRSPIPLSDSLPRDDSNPPSDASDRSRDNSPPRKIRFAPLPDPRRAVLLTEQGDLFPQTSAQPIPQPPSANTSGELIPPTNPLINRNTTPTDDLSDSRTETGSDLGLGTKKKSKKWRKRILRSFLKPTSEKDDTSALIWRQSSRDSLVSNTSGHELGFPLGRRQSASSLEPSTRVRPSSIGSPLTLTRSAEGGPTAPARQQRMLNGRVYGARQLRRSATVQEPAFVEWGYGGMGAVNSSIGSHYAPLQSSNKFSIGTEVNAADEDDGSGMAWVAKRRAAREKARKEKEAALEAERAAEELKMQEPTTIQTPTETDSQQPDGEDVETRPQTPRPSSDTHSMLPTPTPRQSTDGRPADLTRSSTFTSDHEEHHIVKTVSIPGAHPRSQHPRGQNITPLKELAASPVRHASPASPERGSEHGSTTEDDDEDNDDRTEDSETELDEDLEEEARKTALCAGVEKVSRHT